MKLFQILFFLITFQSVSSASYLLDKDSPLCIEDFYIENSRLYYQNSDDLSWSNTRDNQAASNIHFGYDYDADNDTCSPQNWLILGMDVKDFNFLLGLMGVIIGGIFMFFVSYSFVKVGGTK